ncbi:MAG: hypothetical protein CTY35_02975 [Methylotenera sp.]|jgi:hypothetical protein|nr:MAG: hypothetical protein CTY35_02975 [Methylotenera sp.]
MVSKKGISPSRLKLIYQRQSRPPWDETYIPGILATPQEAPSISRAFILTPSKLQGRETHLLSTAERNAALLGLYHPDVIDLQEQRMLSPEPTVHPLWTMLEASRIHLPSLHGIIDVADRLGFLNMLPRLKVKNPKSPKETLTVVFPWFGDLLWAIKKSDGSVFCVNWTIKDKLIDFTKPGPRHDEKLNLTSNSNILARHDIERTYYLDADIPTFRIAGEDIDRNVVANLRQLFIYHRRPIELSRDQQAEIYEKYVSAFEAGIPTGEVISHFVMRGRYSAEQCKTVFYQAIWERRLRVDLFQPILINRPINPETIDVITHYQHWFKAAS